MSLPVKNHGEPWTLSFLDEYPHMWRQPLTEDDEYPRTTVGAWEHGDNDFMYRIIWSVNALAGCRPERLAEVLRLAAAVCAWFHDPDPEDLTRVAARAGALEAALLAFRPESEHGQAL